MSNSTLELVIEFNRDIRQEDLDNIWISSLYFESDNSKLWFGYATQDVGVYDKRSVIFNLSDDDLKTFPHMEQLEEVIKENGLALKKIHFDAINSADDLYPNSIKVCTFTFISDMEVMINKVLIDKDRTYILNTYHFQELYKQWALDMAAVW